MLGGTPAVTGIKPDVGACERRHVGDNHGDDLVGATGVDFGSTPATITSDTATQIVATSPAIGRGGQRDSVDGRRDTSSTTSPADRFTCVPTPTVTTFVGSGLSAPVALAFDAAGNLYVANYGNNTISKVTPAGAVSTFVSSGLNDPMGLAFDAAGNLYVANTATTRSPR